LCICAILCRWLSVREQASNPDLTAGSLHRRRSGSSNSGGMCGACTVNQ
jgi:hypothetical protein